MTTVVYAGFPGYLLIILLRGRARTLSSRRSGDERRIIKTISAPTLHLRRQMKSDENHAGRPVKTGNTRITGCWWPGLAPLSCHFGDHLVTDQPDRSAAPRHLFASVMTCSGTEYMMSFLPPRPGGNQSCAVYYRALPPANQPVKGCWWWTLLSVSTGSGRGRPPAYQNRKREPPTPPRTRPFFPNDLRRS